MINTIYKKKDVIISASTRFSKNLLYQLIFLIKEGAIVLVVLPTIALITKHICLPIII